MSDSLDIPLPKPDSIEETRKVLETEMELSLKEKNLENARKAIVERIEVQKLEERLKKLEAEYAEILEKHESLRTNFLRAKAQGKATFPDEKEMQTNKLSELYPDLWQRYGKNNR